jgi:ferric-dicitrate binding protein FerR (iron transport regulator)
MMQCFVPYGEQKSIQLPDGSVVWLNAGSLLVYPSEFTGNVRSLYLSGQAEFTVVKNKKKPFIVKTNHIEVEALGTVFSVTSFPGDNTTKAILEEGSIRVGVDKQKFENRVLVPNQQLTYAHNSGKITVASIDAKQQAKWKEGYLIFQGATLEEIYKDIERRHNVSISYDNQQFEKGKYNVKFMPNETVEEKLEELRELIPGFNYKIKGNSIYIN